MKLQGCKIDIDKICVSLTAIYSTYLLRNTKNREANNESSI